MPELFEIAFFEANHRHQQKKSGHKAISINAEGLFENSALSEYKWSRDMFYYSGFSVWILSIESFIFTSKNFDAQLEKLADVVNRVFSRSKEIVFATGIYELTGYYLEQIESIEHFNQDLLKHFPLLFFRAKEGCLYSPYNTVNGISIIYNSSAQDLFADPITTLMIDEQIDYNTALKKLGL